MKVKDLAAKLSKMKPDLDVICYTEDEDIIPDGHSFRLFEIDDVVCQEAQRKLGKDERATLKLSKGPCSVPLVILEITSDI